MQPSHNAIYWLWYCLLCEKKNAVLKKIQKNRIMTGLLKIMQQMKKISKEIFFFLSYSIRKQNNLVSLNDRFMTYSLFNSYDSGSALILIHSQLQKLTMGWLWAYFLSLTHLIGLFL